MKHMMKPDKDHDKKMDRMMGTTMRDKDGTMKALQKKRRKK